MAIKSKTQTATPDLQAMFAAFLASQGQAPAQTKPGAWSFNILAQEGTAAIVMATPPKGAAFRAMATVSPEGRVKLGFKLDGNTLAKGFVKLLGSIQ